MKKISFIILSSLFLVVSCSDLNNKFPTEKRYWSIEDYENVVRELKYNYKPDEPLPTFDDSETRIIIEKLTEEENFKVVLNDNELGLSHKNENAQRFFDIWRDLNEIYSPMDKKDMYVYEKEFLEIWKFGLQLQQDYFKLGNEQIIENSDNSESVKEVLSSNTQILINNSIIYLDVIANEKKFTSNSKKIISETITTKFSNLIKDNPKADYSNLSKKIELLNKKIKDLDIKNSLEAIGVLINEVNSNTENEEVE
jgi:hypothetical protein